MAMGAVGGLGDGFESASEREARARAHTAPGPRPPLPGFTWLNTRGNVAVGCAAVDYVSRGCVECEAGKVPPTLETTSRLQTTLLPTVGPPP
eukprot:5592098-Prymnesium_polylepis.1